MSSQALISTASSPFVAFLEPAERCGLIGESAAMQRLRAQIKCIGPYYRTALITGEPGTGKEMAARELHRLSPAAAGSFVPYGRETATLPLQVFESARRGTLFLNEVADWPLDTQETWLHILHRHRPGSAAARPGDARIVAASRHNLKALCATGHFRKDLYHRLAMVELKILPLRERGGDIILLARHFLEQSAAVQKKEVTDIAAAALAVLAAYAWPGNVSELRDAMRQAVARSTGHSIQRSDLPPLGEKLPLPAEPARESVRLDAVVTRHVQQVMQSCGGNKLRAADVLGISRSTLYRMLEKP